MMERPCLFYSRDSSVHVDPRLSSGCSSPLSVRCLLTSGHAGAQTLHHFAWISLLQRDDPHEFEDVK